MSDSHHSRPVSDCFPNYKDEKKALSSQKLKAAGESTVVMPSGDATSKAERKSIKKAEQKAVKKAERKAAKKAERMAAKEKARNVAEPHEEAPSVPTKESVSYQDLYREALASRILLEQALPCLAEAASAANDAASKLENVISNVAVHLSNRGM